MTGPDEANRVEISGWTPGSLGQVVTLHGHYYARDWSFGSYLQTKVAAGMATFIPRLNPDRDLFLVARRGSHMLGFITIDGSETQADDPHVGWFITSDAARGTGTGID